MRTVTDGYSATKAITVVRQRVRSERGSAGRTTDTASANAGEPS
jgi:hypothetical protein